MSIRPSPLISYAQNGEDIILARALRPWENNGFWVDCGAGHPKFDSVTKLFSQFGWTGINIEPLGEEFILLRQDRPQDENIQCLLGAEEGMGIIYAGPAENRGSSTTDPSLVKRYAKEFGQTFRETQVPIRRLNDILREKPQPTIDFLKIDVEGAEAAVLSGVDLKEFNPRIIIIEATRPNSTDPSFETWEPLLLRSGYLFAFFDGLNRYYVNDSDLGLLQPLSIPINVLDDYKTNVQLEIENQNSDLKESSDASILYAESLANTLKEKDLLIADRQQKVIDAESRLVVVKRANKGLEVQLVILHDVKRQLDTIRSYRLFRFLSLAKKVLRKIGGRK